MRSRRPAVRVHPTPPIGPTDRPKDSNQRVRLTESQTRRETPHPSSLACGSTAKDLIAHSQKTLREQRRTEVDSEQGRGSSASDDQPATERDLAIYQAQRAHELELNKATAAFEHALVSPLFLLNGGAVVAFLTLLGAASAKDSHLRVNLATGSRPLGSGLWA
jgi:hypothetical protein